MDYDETRVLTSYVWSHCQHLMTDVERRADRAGMIGIKAAAAEERGNASLARALSKHRDSVGGPEIEAALSDGWDAFRQRVLRRLLADDAVRAMINRCPQCCRIVRSPLARQCLWCKHVWRGRERGEADVR